MLKLDLTLYNLYTNQKVSPFIPVYRYSLLGFFIIFPVDMLFIMLLICILTLLFGSIFFLCKVVKIAYLKLLST